MARRRALEKALEILGAARRDAASDGFYEDLRRRPQKFTGWVDKTNATLGRRGAGAFGFKWMFTQGVLEDLAGWFFDFCLEHGVKLVWLRRRNLFKQHLSSKLTLAPDARDGKVALDAAQVLELLRDHAAEDAAIARAAKESEIPNFKGSYLGRFPLVSADFWTSDHRSERSRSVDAFFGTRARGTLTLKRR